MYILIFLCIFLNKQIDDFQYIYIKKIIFLYLKSLSVFPYGLNFVSDKFKDLRILYVKFYFLFKKKNNFIIDVNRIL